MKENLKGHSRYDISQTPQTYKQVATSFTMVGSKSLFLFQLTSDSAHALHSGMK